MSEFKSEDVATTITVQLPNQQITTSITTTITTIVGYIIYYTRPKLVTVLKNNNPEVISTYDVVTSITVFKRNINPELKMKAFATRAEMKPELIRGPIKHMAERKIVK